jgi:putative copper resistance protein D
LVDAVAVLARALSFIALFQATGGAVFLAVFGTELVSARGAMVRPAPRATILAGLLVLLQFSLETARLAGDFSALGDPRLLQLIWHTALGTALRLRLAGLLLILTALALKRWPWALRPLAAAGTALAVAAFASVGHSVDHPQRAVLATLLMVHLFSLTYWFGALWPLRQAVTRESSATAAALLERFSRIALWIVPVLFLAGGTLAILLVPGWSVFDQPYGRLLLAKLLGFGVLMGCAALNKLRLTPGLRRNEAAAAVWLRRSLLGEYLLIGAVLAITAVMTGLYSPD